ncbi:MAG: hypothetical protein IT436_03950 [Phycisphaerales bacterium]|nr:hypothetical protein [Phycisphaerales bacterium]
MSPRTTADRGPAGPRRRACRPARVLVACVLALGILSSTAARADESVDKANESYALIKADRRSDTVLLPLLAKLQPPPAAVNSREKVALLFAGSAAWPEAKSWAEGATQQALVTAVKQVSREGDPRVAYGFGQPYGVEGVGPELVRARLYTELGDPPTLAAARFLYIEGLDKLALLVHVEARRLAAEGKVSDGVDLLVDWVWFARQIADRRMAAEVRWGLRQIIDGARSIRDVMYMDFRGSRAIDRDRLAAAIERLDPERGFLDLSRLMFPDGDKLAARQLIARVYTERGGVNAATFASTMAALESTERPLRLFGEASRWTAAGTKQKNWFDVNEQLDKIYNDWTSRWRLGYFERRMEAPWEYASMDRSSFAVIDSSVDDLSTLFGDRQEARLELVGTRMSMGIVGYFYETKNFPPQISSIRPKWVRQIDADPFNPARDRGQQPPLEYFVPMRDTRDQVGAREDPKPHEMNIFVPGMGNFSVRLRDDQFVLYSVGVDGGKGWARKVTNTLDRSVKDADYLIWPPIHTLYRQYLIDNNQLK